ncbi:hypothetical protein [Chryseobacterium sp.]
MGRDFSLNDGHPSFICQEVSIKSILHYTVKRYTSVAVRNENLE